MRDRPRASRPISGPPGCGAGGARRPRGGSALAASASASSVRPSSLARCISVEMLTRARRTLSSWMRRTQSAMSCLIACGSASSANSGTSRTSRPAARRWSPPLRRRKVKPPGIARRRVVDAPRGRIGELVRTEPALRSQRCRHLRPDQHHARQLRLPWRHRLVRLNPLPIPPRCPAWCPQGRRPRSCRAGAFHHASSGPGRCSAIAPRGPGAGPPAGGTARVWSPPGCGQAPRPHVSAAARRASTLPPSPAPSAASRSTCHAGGALLDRLGERGRVAADQLVGVLEGRRKPADPSLDALDRDDIHGPSGPQPGRPRPVEAEDERLREPPEAVHLFTGERGAACSRRCAPHLPRGRR